MPASGGRGRGQSSPRAPAKRSGSRALHSGLDPAQADEVRPDAHPVRRDLIGRPESAPERRRDDQATSGAFCPRRRERRNIQTVVELADIDVGRGQRRELQQPGVALDQAGHRRPFEQPLERVGTRAGLDQRLEDARSEGRELREGQLAERDGRPVIRGRPFGLRRRDEDQHRADPLSPRAAPARCCGSRGTRCPGPRSA